MRRRPRRDRRSTAHDERHILPKRDAELSAARVAIRRQGGKRAVDPACLQRMRPRAAVLEHILAVEMRTLTIGTGHGVKDDELLGSKGLVQKGKAGMQTEEPVELERAPGRSRRGDRDFTAQSA